MASERQTARRLDYLHLASDFMLVKSPSLSCYLRAEGVELATQKELTPLNGGKLTCRACGNAMIPGWSCRSKSLARGKRSRSGEQKPNVRLLQCDRCNSTSRVKEDIKRQVVVPPRTVRAPKPTEPDVVPDLKEVAPTAPEPSKESSNASGTSQDAEQPAKAPSTRRSRNKKTSLQAMLAKSKADPPAGGGKGFGLDFEDFLKG